MSRSMEEILAELRAAVDDSTQRAIVIGRIRQLVDDPQAADVRQAVREVLAALDQVRLEQAQEREGTDVPEAGCTAPATVIVEAYSSAGRSLYGSLDRAEYVCAAHVKAATARIAAESLTPFRSPYSPCMPRECGYVFDYTRRAGESS